MPEIKTVNGRQVIDYMARDFNSFRQTLIERIPDKLPHWTDLSEADFGIVLIELFAHMADILSYYQDRIANESFLSTAQERRSVMQHLRLIGYEMAPAAPASALLKLTFAVDNSETGSVTIRRGDKFSSESSQERPSVQFEYAERTPLVIDLHNLIPDSGGPGRKRFQSGTPLHNGTVAPFIPIQEGRFVAEELLGVSDGRPNQRYVLARPKMIRGSLDLRVQQAELAEPWEQRESLVYSRAEDQHYTLLTDDNDVTTIMFGDGDYGKIPPLSARLVATYRVGGGRFGNVPAGTITSSDAPDLTPLGASVVNEKPARGGEELESIEHAIRFAPLVFKSNRRAVTVEDFIGLAKQFPGVAKARAEGASWNYVYLYIAPAGGGVASDVMKAELLTYFEDKRMMTTQVVIKDPHYVPVYLSARLNAKPFALNAEVAGQVKAAIKNLLDFDKVDFKEIIFLSKVYEAIEAIPGVDSVYVSQFRSRSAAQVTEDREPGYDADDAIERGGRIAMGENEIPVPGYADLIELIVEGGL